jgi:murein DD-endopeptidase MepM/ murein hydrolase activator NlpD
VALLAAFSLGVLVDGVLRTYGPPLPASEAAVDAETNSADSVAPAAGKPQADRTRREASDDHDRAEPGPIAVPTTGSGKLRVPIDDATVESFKGGFAERRGDREHEAVDILAPRNTPIHAVDNGTVAKLFVSKQGGITIYQFDPTGHLCYYYAHLERYAPGLHEGDAVTQGQVIGYVGTSGNAPPNTPHLHFAVSELGTEKKWWKGRAIDPYLVFRDRAIEVHTH